MTDLLAAALEYAAARVYVFPARITVVDGKKIVAPVAEWRKASTTTAETLRGWFAPGQRWADASLCIDCGKSQLVVIDLDVTSGHDGLTAWGALMAEHDIAPTPVRSHTPSGGEHWFYREHERRVVGIDSSGKVAAGVDIRGLGGFVIAWPSEDARGAYGTIHPAELATVPVVPDLVIERMNAKPAPAPPSAVATPAGPVAAHPAWDDTELNARTFTMAQAVEFIRPSFAVLRGAKVGTINGHLNTAAKVLSHFVSAFWTRLEAEGFLHDALGDTDYDGQTWKAENTIESAFRSAVGDWKATRLADPVNEEAEEFWTARPELTAIRDAARARLVSPWATLGATLAMVCSQVGPHVVLPPTIGGDASLNTFVALVGASGAGKDAALAVARELLWTDDRVPTREVGTGQGIDAAFTVQSQKNGPVQYCDAALFTVTEIDTLAAHAAQGGATIMPTLRKVYSGAALGAFYADKFKRRPVAAHSYRAALIAGVQPARSGTLLKDVDGGTPQRWIWLPTNDPGALAEPAPYQIPRFGIWKSYASLAPAGEMTDEQPVSRRHRVEIRICDTARAAIIGHRQAQLRGAVTAAIDGHALLTRLKVAALLCLLDGGRTEVTDDDWNLAGTVMAVSDRIRELCTAALAETSQRANVAKAMEEVERGRVVATQAERRVAAALLRILQRAPDGMSRSDLRRALPGRDRDLFEVGLDALRNAGQIDEEESDRGKKYVTRG
jgi:hypothetical protein